jgi:hypothetical protein
MPKAMQMFIAATACGILFGGSPDVAGAQKAPARFCPEIHAISRNPHTDRTNTKSDTLGRVLQVERRYSREILGCSGVIAVGVGSTGRRQGPYGWVLAITMNKRDMPSKSEPLIIEGIRIMLWSHETTGPHQL